MDGESKLQSYIKRTRTGKQNTTWVILSSKFYCCYFSLSLPLFNIDLENADCQETVRNPENNIG